MINIVGKNKHVDLALQRTYINTISSTTVVMIELCWNTQVIFFCTELSVFQTLFCIINLCRCVHRCIIRRDFFVCYGFKFIIFLQRFRVIITATVLHCFWFVICLLFLCMLSLMTGQTFTPASVALWDWQKYCPLLLPSSLSLSKLYDWGACFFSSLSCTDSNKYKATQK